MTESKPLKRFLLFAHWDYYPQGGIEDLEDSFDTLEEAEDASEKVNDQRVTKTVGRYENVYIVDSATGERLR